MRPQLETLEERSLLSIAPLTPWHLSLGTDVFAQGSFNAPGDPGSAGFNLVPVFSPADLARLPAGDKAVVWVGQTDGVDQHFLNTVLPFAHDPRVFAYYVADEPNPALVPAANLEAESDFLHASNPGAHTFFVMANDYQAYTPWNTHMDWVALDPYPITTYGDWYWAIPFAVFSAESLGWSPDRIIPVYQAFGDTGVYVSPTPAQEITMLAIWGFVDGTPPMDYAFSWSPWGAQSLVERPDLQAIFLDHNTNPPVNPTVLLDYILSHYYTNPALLAR